MKATIILLLVAVLAVAFIHAHEDGNVESIITNDNVEGAPAKKVETVEEAAKKVETVSEDNKKTEVVEEVNKKTEAVEGDNKKTEVVEEVNKKTETVNEVAKKEVPTKEGESTKKEDKKPEAAADETVKAAAFPDSIASVPVTNVTGNIVTFKNEVFASTAEVTLANVVVTNNTAAPLSNFTCYQTFSSASAGNTSAAADTRAAYEVAKNVTAAYANMFSFNFTVFSTTADFENVQKAAGKAFPNANVSYNPIFFKGCNMSNATLIGNYSAFLVEMTPFLGDASSIFSSVVALSSVTVAAAMLLL
jgi:outer membrane biosynthesis protein TonB